MEFVIRDKKGQEEGGGGIPVAMWLVLIVVAVIILIPFVGKQVTFASEVGDSAICYASIVGSMLSSEEARAKCPVGNYKIYNNLVKMTTEGKTKESEIVKDFSANEEKVNELLAKLMGSCLQKVGGVYSRAFSRTWFTSSTVCLECFNIEFDKEIGKIFFGGLREYLEKNNVPGKNLKYIDFFTKNVEHKEDWINYGIKNNLIPGKDGLNIEKDKSYAVFFVGIKEGTTQALVDGRLIGREDVYFVYTSDLENFNKICDRKVN